MAGMSKRIKIALLIAALYFSAEIFGMREYTALLSGVLLPQPAAVLAGLGYIGLYVACTVGVPIVVLSVAIEKAVKAMRG